MKVKPKKGHPVNSDIQAVVDAVLKAPQERFAPVLAKFEWRFDKVGYSSLPELNATSQMPSIVWHAQPAQSTVTQS